jgi:hypothetical protein
MAHCFLKLIYLNQGKGLVRFCVWDGCKLPHLEGGVRRVGKGMMLNCGELVKSWGLEHLGQGLTD